VGRPQGIQGLTDIVNSPMYATGVGLVLWGKKEFYRRGFKGRESTLFHRIWGRVKDVVVEYFV
jgi:cell division protein FtsA